MRDWRRHANCKSPRSYGVGEVLGGWWTLEENVNENTYGISAFTAPRSLVVTVLPVRSVSYSFTQNCLIASFQSPRRTASWISARVYSLPRHD